MFPISPVLYFGRSTVSKFIEDEAVEELYSHQDFDNSNNIFDGSDESERSNYKLPNYLLNAFPGPLPVEFFATYIKNNVSEISFADYEPLLANKKKFYTSYSLKNGGPGQ